METEVNTNLYKIPISALRPSTRQIIVNELNRRKVLASEEGLPRDWRGLAHLTGIPEPSGDSPADQLLTIWNRQSDASLGKLEEYLGRLDRWDIVDDVYKLIREDAEGVTRKAAEQYAADTELDKQIFTYDDVRMLEVSGRPMHYDALLLYADQDEGFARQMFDRLTNDYELKVCMKDNLVGGFAFEHQGLLKLIQERCRRVIIILTHSFLQSPVIQFAVAFAQALSINGGKRIIVPCMYERIDMELPFDIRILYKLDYNKHSLHDYNFWDRLKKSVESAPEIRPSTVAIREIISSNNNLRAIMPKMVEAPSHPPVYASNDTNCSIQYRKEHVEMKEQEKFCSNTTLIESCTSSLSCSSLSLPEKDKGERKSNTASAVLKKIFKRKKKPQKISVKL